MYKVLLDSGAWSAYTQKKTISIDAYMEYIRENIKYIDYYVNLDVIGDPLKSFENYKIMRDNGFTPIPVFHAETVSNTRTFLYKYLNYTNYVAIGAIAKMHTKRRIENLDLYFKSLVDDKGFPIAKFHGFGLTSLRILKYYPWFSVDSSSWVQYGRYGIILIPKRTNDHWDYKSEPYKVVVSSRRQDDQFHITKYSTSQKSQFSQYLEEIGYDYAKVSTNNLNRDKVNLVYYLGIQETILKNWPRKLEWSEGTTLLGDMRSRDKPPEEMKGENVIYIAGNFPIMNDIKKERELKEKYPTSFNRLISFFWKESGKTVLQLKKEDLDGSLQKGSTQQP